MDPSEVTWERLFISARDSVSRTVVPVFRLGEKKSLIGSGFLIRHGFEDFLITAGHVLQECLPEIRGGDTFTTGWIHKTSTEFVNVGGGITLTKPGSKIHDLGIVRLHDRFDSPTDVDVLERKDIEAGIQQPPSPIFIAIGFPLSRSLTQLALKRHSAKVYPILTVMAENDSYRDQGLSQVNSLLLKYRNTDDNGRKLFNPVGMSGGPVWSVRLQNGELLWTLRGMLVERLSKGTLLRCIPIEVILEQMDLTPPRKFKGNGRMTIE